MKKFYKIFVCLLVGLLIATLNISSAGRGFVQPDWKGNLYKGQNVDPAKLDQHELSGGIANGTDYETNKLQGILQFPERSNYATPLGYALRLVQISINWLLGILASVALVYMLYCGFLIFSSGSEDKNAQKGRKGISTAAIALAGIGLSWLIVSAMIWFVTILTQPK